MVTIFPGMLQAVLAEGVLGRAVERGVVDVGVHDLRDYTSDRHRTVDDVPYGGGPGMVLKPEPFVRASAAIRRQHGEPAAVVLLSPQGRPFRHVEAVRLSRLHHVVLLCGRYEGIDERVRQQLATEEISIGDYVLSGGSGGGGGGGPSRPGCCRGCRLGARGFVRERAARLPGLYEARVARGG